LQKSTLTLSPAALASAASSGFLWNLIPALVSVRPIAFDGIISFSFGGEEVGGVSKAGDFKEILVGVTAAEG
jgi:hypothetical protein